MDNRTIGEIGAVILIAILGLAFYWYEYRPSQIRATCEAQAVEQAMQSFSQAAQSFNEIMGNLVPESFQEALPEALPEEGLYNEANKEAYYLSCVREHGLER
jgi:hypothetical protein